MNEARERQVHLYRAILLAAGLVVLGLLFRQLVTLALAVLMTVIIAIPLSTIADRLERRGVPRPLGVATGLAGLLAVLAIVLSFVVPRFVEEIQGFVDDVPEVVTDLQDLVHDVTGAKTEDIGATVQDYLQGYVDDPERLIDPLTRLGLGLAGAFGALILMLVTAVFMAIRPDPLIQGLLRLVPPPRRDDGRRVLARLRESWIGWMQGVGIDMLITGVLVYLGLTIVGLDFALVFSVISALLVVVPYFGAFVGGALPTLFALTDSPGKALAVMLIYVGIQQVESNITIPLVMSRIVRLHPAAIAIGVVVVGQLFGLVGLLVAVPLLSAIVILVEELYVVPMEHEHVARQREPIELPSGATAAPHASEVEPPWTARPG